MSDEAVAVWSGAWHDDPEDAADAWEATGSGTFTVATRARRITQSAPSTDPTTYRRQASKYDTSTGPTRETDDLEWQARVQGVSSSPAWADGAAAIGLHLSDGARELGVAIGSQLQWIHPSTGRIIGTIATAWPWLTPRSYILRKTGTATWSLTCDGLVLAELPYLRAPAAATPTALGAVGVLDTSGTGSVDVLHMELVLNAAAAPTWDVDRWMIAIAPGITRNLPLWGLLWSIVGGFASVAAAMMSVWPALTAARSYARRLTFVGDVLPSSVDARWTLTSSSMMSIVRERVRLAGDGSAHAYIEAALTAPHASIALDEDLEYTAAARFTLQSYTPDAAGRVGPFLRVNNHHRIVTAQLLVDADGGLYWTLAGGATTGALTTIGRGWYVGAGLGVEHHVEVQVLGRTVVVLLVDGQIVEQRPYSELSAGPGAYTTQIGVAGTAGLPVCTVDVTDGAAHIRGCDLTPRPGLQTSAIERTMALGGCERNDLVETWSQRFLEQVKLRGTDRGILVELDRMTCSVATRIVQKREPASWYLERSWPEVTPIFLERLGDFARIYVEFTNATPPQMDADAIALWARRYLVPLTSTAFRYYICVATRLSALAPAPSGGTIELAVLSTSSFAVGDAVTIRTDDNTASSDTRVAVVTDATTLEIDSVPGTWPAGCVLRKTLATT